MRYIAALALVVLAVGAASAEPFVVPPLNARVIDTGNRLTATQRKEIDETLAGFRQRTGVPIVVFIPASLAGNTIEDVAYQTFNTWKLGDKGKDNGVLIVIAVDERRARIEVGAGLGGALTDLQANDVIREKMAPLLAQGQLREAIDAAFIAIAAAIESDPTVINPRTGSEPTPASSVGTDWTRYILYGVIALVVLALFRRGRGGRGGPGRGSRGRWFGGGLGGWGGFGGSGGGFGGRGGGGFGGGRGGNDFGGGGGRSGGGGSSDSF